MSVIEHLQDLAVRYPEKPLFEWLERTSPIDLRVEKSLTYGEVWTSICNFANTLRDEYDLENGDRVLLCYPPGLDFLLAFLGCIAANLIPVPSYPPNPQALNATIPAFAKIQSLANATIVLTNKEYHRWTSLKILAKWPSGLTWVITDSLFTSINTPKEIAIRTIHPTDIAFLQFTSGSTGDPKGVIITHGALWASFRGMTIGLGSRIPQAHPPYSEQTPPTPFTMLSWLPLYHDMGLVLAALLPIYRGGKAILYSPLDFIAQPLSWVQAMSKYQVDISAAPNFAFDLVVRRWRDVPAQQRPKLDLSSVRAIVTGGEQIRARTLMTFSNTFSHYNFTSQAFCPTYGCAEATVGVSVEICREITFAKSDPDLISCGGNFHEYGMLVAVLNQRWKHNYAAENTLLDTDIAVEGEIGEVLITGNALFSGYWGQKGNNAEPKSKHSLSLASLPPILKSYAAEYPNVKSDVWFCTGDLGMLEKGHLFITGRIKELIVVRGRNYIPQDIEHTVTKEVPEVRPGCVAALALSESDSSTEEVLILCEIRSVLPDRETKNVLRKIQMWLASTHSLNASVALLKKGTLPKTSSGKLQRLKATNMWKAGSLKPVAYQTTSPSEAAVDASTEAIRNHDVPISIPQTEALLPIMRSDESAAHGDESSAWDTRAAFSDRFSALQLQLCRIIDSYLITLDVASENGLDSRRSVGLATKWADLGLDSLSAVMILQSVQDEANRNLRKQNMGLLILAPSLLYEHEDLKSLIQHLISLHHPDHDNDTTGVTADQIDFDHVVELPRPASAVRCVFFAVLQALWMFLMWSTAIYLFQSTLDILPSASLPWMIVMLPLAHYLLVLSFATGTVLVKNILIGTYRPGFVPQYGGQHLRFWMVESAVKLVDILGMRYLHNTKVYEVYLRRLGTQISHGANINTPINTAFDLLSIGPDAVIDSAAVVSCHQYQAGCLFFSPVDIGELAIVEKRAVIQMSATVWRTSPDKRVQASLAHLPPPYTLGDSTVLRHGNRKPCSITAAHSITATVWKQMSEIPFMRWVYSFLFFWLQDANVVFAAATSLKMTECLIAASPFNIFNVLEVPSSQVIRSVFTAASKRQILSVFSYGPQIFAPTLFLCGISLEDSSGGNLAIGHYTYESHSSATLLVSMIATAVLTYLGFILVLSMTVCLIQHQFVPKLRHNDIVLQHSYSGAVRHLYANLIRRLHDLCFFITTGTSLATAFYRLSGARIGKNVIFGLIEPIVEPGLVTVEDYCFVGDFSHLTNFSAISSSNGCAHRASQIHLEQGSLVGMNSLVQADAHSGDFSKLDSLRLPPKCMLGANSTLDNEMAMNALQAFESNGKPVAIFGRRIFNTATGESTALHKFSNWWKFLYYLVWPIAILPGLLLWFMLSYLPAMVLVNHIQESGYGDPNGVIWMGPLLVLCAVGSVGQLVIAKWVLVQRFVQRTYSIDSLYFLRRLAYAHCLDFSASFILEMMKGTPYLPSVFSMLGAKIGARVQLETVAITEPDLCEIQDDCSINSFAVLFGHSLDRGRFQQAHLVVGTGSTMNNHALLLLGTVLGDATALEHSSATMGHSMITGFAKYAGLPPKIVRSNGELRAAYEAWKIRDSGDKLRIGSSNAVSKEGPISTKMSSNDPFKTKSGCRFDLPRPPSASSSCGSQLSIDGDISTERSWPSSDMTVQGETGTSRHETDASTKVVPQSDFGNQYKGSKPKCHDPETLDQPRGASNISAMLDLIGQVRSQAKTPIKVINLAFADEVQYWQEQFSERLGRIDSISSEDTLTILYLGRLDASASDLNALVAKVRSMPHSGDVTRLKAEDGTLTDWAEHRRQLSQRVDRMCNPKPYSDHSAYAENLDVNYGLVALDLICQIEVDWMLWLNFAWVILAFQDPPTISLLASSRRLFSRSVNRVTAVDALILPAMVWGRFSKRGRDGDARMNTIHGRYAHTASGIKCLWMSILDSYEWFRRRMDLPEWSDIEWNSFYMVLSDHMIAMGVNNMEEHWVDELRRHRKRIQNLKYRTWPVATAIVGNTMEDYLGRIPVEARRPMRQLLAIACPEDMLDGMGYRPFYPREDEFEAMKSAMQGFYQEEKARERQPHSLSSHVEIGGWKPRAEKFGPNERGTALPQVLTGPTNSDVIRPYGNGICPIPRFQGALSSRQGVTSEPRTSAGVKLEPSNFGYRTGQKPAYVVEDVLLPEDLIEVTRGEVAKHCNDRLGYWVIVGRYVYDVTLPLLDDVHPGGGAILRRYAGKDATSAFKAHSEDARIVACNFIVAKLEGSSGNVRER